MDSAKFLATKEAILEREHQRIEQDGKLSWVRATEAWLEAMQKTFPHPPSLPYCRFFSAYRFEGKRRSASCSTEDVTQLLCFGEDVALPHCSAEDIALTSMFS